MNPPTNQPFAHPIDVSAPIHDNGFAHAGVTVVPAREEHLPAVVEVLRSVRSVHPYPPKEDVPDPSDDALRQWLTGEPNIGRWVALVGDVVAGHVQVCRPHPYLTNHLDMNEDALGEISKLFVSPEASHHGAGRLLLATACRYTWAIYRTPALAVVDTSHAAIALYRSAGLTDRGSFDGIHGRNLVMVAERAVAPERAPAPELNSRGPHHPDLSRRTRTTANFFG